MNLDKKQTRSGQARFAVLSGAILAGFLLLTVPVVAATHLTFSHVLVTKTGTVTIIGGTVTAVAKSSASISLQTRVGTTTKTWTVTPHSAIPEFLAILMSKNPKMSQAFHTHQIPSMLSGIEIGDMVSLNGKLGTSTDSIIVSNITDINRTQRSNVTATSTRKK